MVQEIKLNQIDTVVTTVGTPGTDGNLPTEKAVRDAITAGGGVLASSGTITRNVNTASNVQTVSHTLGVTPSYIKFYYSTNFNRTSGVPDSTGTGIFDGINNTALGVTSNTPDVMGLSTIYSIVRSISGAQVVFGAVSAVTTTDFDITWTKPGGTIGSPINLIVIWEAYA